MGKRRIVRKPVIYYGKPAGTHKGDRHWLDPEGNTWDSKYEYLVWRAYTAAGVSIRRTNKGDTFSFVLAIKRGKCAACGSDQVGQQRTYTPDFYVTAYNTQSEAIGYYIEAKGYLRPKERALLRAFYKAHQDAPVRYLLQRNFPAGAKSKQSGDRSSIVDWFHKFLPQSKIALWQGRLPNELEFNAAPPPVSKLAGRKAGKKTSAARAVPRTRVKRLRGTSGIPDSRAVTCTSGNADSASANSSI